MPDARSIATRPPPGGMVWRPPMGGSMQDTGGVGTPVDGALVDDAPVGLWATGRTRYQGGSTHTPGSRDHLPQGTWRSGGYRSSRRRSWRAVGMVGAVILGYAAGVAVDLWGFTLLAAAEAGTLTVAQGADYDGLVATVAGLTAALYVVSALFFLAWLSRLVDNTPPLTGRTPVRGPRQAIGWWFVPLAFLFVPYGIVRDTMEELAPVGRSAGRIVLAWWLLFLASNVTSSLTTALTRNATTLDDLRVSLVASALQESAALASGVLLIVVIRTAERWSEARATALRAQAGETPVT